MSISEQRIDFFEVGDNTSLICTDPNVREIVRATLRDLGFKFHTAENPDTAIERTRYTPYDMILLQDDFAGTILATNPVLKYLAQLPMDQRRHSMVVLIGSGFKTLDAMEAFEQSVQLVVNTLDLPSFTAILKKGWTEFQSFYKVYKDVFAAVGQK